jgi:hypothetical protein
VLLKRDGAMGTDLQTAVTSDAVLMVAFRSGMEGNDPGRTFFPAETAADAPLSIESDSGAGKEPGKIYQIRKICRQRFFE